MLNKSISVSIILDDGTTSTVEVRQLPVKEYEAAFLLNDDELGLTAKFCGKIKDWIYTVSPESYESLVATSKEVNAAFFGYATRRYQEQTARLAAVPQEVLAKFASASEKALKPSLPALQPRAV